MMSSLEGHGFLISMLPTDLNLMKWISKNGYIKGVIVT